MIKKLFTPVPPASFVLAETCCLCYELKWGIDWLKTKTAVIQGSILIGVTFLIMFTTGFHNSFNQNRQLGFRNWDKKKQERRKEGGTVFFDYTAFLLLWFHCRFKAIWNLIPEKGTLHIFLCHVSCNPCFCLH